MASIGAVVSAGIVTGNDTFYARFVSLFSNISKSDEM
jgi:hypothetical protein